MSASHEVSLGFAWIYSTLSGDSTLNATLTGGVWRALAPPSTVAPYVVMIYQAAGKDSVAFRGTRAYSDLLYQVKAVGPSNSYASLVALSARLDTLLTLATQVAVTGGTILGCYRSSPLQVDELVNGELWSNIGGLYRMVAKSA
jgi:hypothetical protein